MNKRIKKTLKIVLPGLWGGFILYWVYRDFDFERAKELLLHGTDWGWMLFSMFFLLSYSSFSLKIHPARVVICDL